MSKPLSAERLWCLKWWSTGGWSNGRPMSRGVGKWENHIAMLTKSGLLEVDDYGMHRITDLGRSALGEQPEVKE